MSEDASPAEAEPLRRGAGASELTIEVRMQVSDRQLPLHADDKCASALGSMGRTEDLALSPDGSLIVIPGFDSNRMSLVRFSIGDDGVQISDVRPTAVDSLVRPHGLAFLDDTTMLVANRESELSLVRLDDRRTKVTSSTVLIDGSDEVPVRTPGSVAARDLGGNLAEVFVCNNYVHDVTRYVLDGRQDWSIIDRERLLADQLEIPDGVAVSESGTWIAVSNHNRHAVYLYRYDDGLTVDTPPHGVLRGMSYPHGLSFLDGDRHLIVSDAGQPHLYTFETLDGDWSGERTPSQIDRVMDEQVFLRGRYNPQEGGPKGIEVVAEGIVAVTSEFQPLAFFALRQGAVPGEPPSTRSAIRSATSSDLRTPILRLADRLSNATRDARRTATELDEVGRERAGLVAELAARRSECDEIRIACSTAERETDHVRSELEGARRQHADASEEMDHLIERIGTLEAHIDRMHASKSWRWSSPLRGCYSLAGRIRSAVR
jgi:DNA-binding beta-propeller fold protein YncE